MSDRQAFPFDGAGDFSRAAVMIRHHACVSNDGGGLQEGCCLRKVLHDGFDPA